MDTSTKKVMIKINVFLIIFVLGTLGILFFILPKQKISIVEKRKLQPMPYLTWQQLMQRPNQKDSIYNFHFEKVLSGYIDSLDLYFSDNFPFREDFVSLSFAFKDAQGFKSKQLAFYDAAVEMNKTPQEKPQPSNPTQSKLKSDSTQKIKQRPNVIEEATASHGVMIYKKMAIQVFGGTKASCKYFTDVANLYRDSIPDSVQVYVAVTPTHGAYYLPEKYRKTSEIDNINTIYDNLKEGIHKVDIAGTLRQHTDEYIFFNTDHHWTGLGAFYAYKTFCKEANITPVELKCHKRKVKHGFLGSLYWLTRDKGLKENADSVVYYKPLNSYKTVAFTEQHPDIAVPTTLFAEYAKGPDSYGVYLGADHPLMRVDTKLDNGRRLLIMKNSYGNPFSTYMIPHFDRVYIMDYRHYEKNVLELIQKEKITDVIFFNNTFLANTIPHALHFKKLLTMPRSDEKPKEE